MILLKTSAGYHVYIYTFYKNWMHYSKKSPYKRLHSYAIYISKI